MFLQIDPQLSVLWRSLSEVQFGAPDPVALVTVIDDWELTLIEHLRVGIDSARLQEIAARNRAVDAVGRCQTVLSSVERAFETRRSRLGELGTFRVIGDAEPAQMLRQSLERVGFTATAEAPNLTVLLSHFTVHPFEAQRLLSTDQTHIAMVCDDDQIRLSQLVIPGATPCLYCYERSEHAHDEAWATIAPQLLRRRGAAVFGIVASMAAIELAYLLRAYARDENRPSDALVIRENDITRRSVPAHPDCGCCSLSQTVTPIAHLEAQLQPSSPQAHLLRA